MTPMRVEDIGHCSLLREFFQKLSYTDNGSSHRAPANLLGAVASSDSHGKETLIERLKDCSCRNASAHEARGSMLNVNRGSNSNFIALAVRLQGKKCSSFH